MASKTKARAARRGSEAKTGKIKGGYRADFTGVEGRVLLPEGKYVCTVESIEVKDGQEYEYFSWKFKTEVEGKPKLDGKTIYYNTSLAPNALWNLRNLLEALGADIPEGPLDIQFDELIGEQIVLTIEHEEYEGKEQAKVKDFSPYDADNEPESGDDDNEDVDVEDDRSSKRGSKAKSKSKAKGKSKKDEEEETTWSQEEVAAMSAEELQDVIDEAELDVDLDEYKVLRKKQNAVIDALEEAGRIED